MLGLIFYQSKYYATSEYQLSDANIDYSEENIETRRHHIGLIDDYDAIVQRPLFSSSRKPPKVQKQFTDISVNTDELDELTVIGIVKSGDTAFAILGNLAGEDDAKQVKTGFNYKGWKVSQITTNSVKFMSDELEYELFISPGDISNSSVGARDNRVRTSVPAVSNQRINPKNSNSKKSPIKIPRSNQLGNQVPRTKEEQELLDEIAEEGGFSFDLDDTFDNEYD